MGEGSFKQRFEPVNVRLHGDVHHLAHQGSDFGSECLALLVVALRRFVDDDGTEEWAPSFPATVREVRVIDTIIPPGPAVGYVSGLPLPGSPRALVGRVMLT